MKETTSRNVSFTVDLEDGSDISFETSVHLNGLHYVPEDKNSSQS
jgi:hypothetical protein